MKQHIALSAALAAALAVMSTGASAALKDGTYETQVIGHNAPFTVKVIVKDGKVTTIDSIRILSRTASAAWRLRSSRRRSSTISLSA